MKITRQNYEEYALDYIEGSLEPPVREEFERFLDMNPDLAGDAGVLLEGMPVLTPDPAVKWEDKTGLKRKASRRPLFIRIAAAAAVLIGGVVILDRMEQEIDPVEAVHSVSAHRTATEAVPQQDTLTGRQTAQRENVPGDAVPVRESVEPVKTGKAGEQTNSEKTGREQMNAGEKASAGVKDPLRAGEIPTQGTEMAPDNGMETAGRVKRERIELLAGTLQLRDIPEPGISSLLDKEPAHAKTEIAPARVVIISEEYIIEDARTAREYFVEETPENNLGLLNLFNRKGLKRLTAGILTPLSALNPVSVHETHEQRVVEVASITISRKSVQKEEKSN